MKNIVISGAYLESLEENCGGEKELEKLAVCQFENLRVCIDLFQMDYKYETCIRMAEQLRCLT